MKAVSLVLLGFVVSGSLAQAREYDPARYQAMERKVEQIKCQKSAEYCDLQKVLSASRAELKNVSKVIQNLTWQTGRICESTSLRRLERSEADGMGAKYTVRTQCSEIPEYVESAAPVLAELSNQLANKDELERQVAYLAQLVKSSEPLLDPREFSEAVAASNF